MLVLVCFITTFTSVTLLAKDYSASQAGKTIDSLDVDGNGQVDALTDGLLLLRSMFGLSGDSLINGVISYDAFYTSSSDIEARVSALGTRTDIDSDGDIDALTDGLIILRYLFGIRGDAMTNGVIADGGQRKTPDEIEDYMNSLTSDSLVNLVPYYYGTKFPVMYQLLPEVMSFLMLM